MSVRLNSTQERESPRSRAHTAVCTQKGTSQMQTLIFTLLTLIAIGISAGASITIAAKKHKKKRQANTPTDDAATDGIEKRHADGRENHMATGMCLGMCFGCAIGSSLIARFGPEALSCGISFGMLLGMTVGMNIKQKK